jgi:glutathione S-transferase
MAIDQPTTPLAPVTLYEFSLSHYNEKARWALDYKGISYDSKPVLPGLHFSVIKKLSGQTSTPVLQLATEVVSGSANIVNFVDAMKPTPALQPDSIEDQKEAETWVTWLDGEVGPLVRLALFDALLVSPVFASTFFSQNMSSAKRTFYRGAFPAIAKVIKKQLGVNAQAALEAREVIDPALTRVARAASETGYLVGDGFTVADLTAGALFFPLFYPEQLPNGVPDRSHPVFKAWLDDWRDHQGRAYVEALFRKHR